VWVEGEPAGYVLDVTDTTVPPPGAVPDPVEESLELAVHYPTRESAVLQVDGELDALTCVRFGQRALALLVDRPDLIIDLSQVRFMGSSALKVLIDAHDAALARQGQLHIVTGDQPTVVRPITRTALNRLLRLHPDLGAALAALSLPG
jgi:anti-sigma B factor antagonist